MRVQDRVAVNVGTTLELTLPLVEAVGTQVAVGLLLGMLARLHKIWTAMPILKIENQPEPSFFLI